MEEIYLSIQTSLTVTIIVGLFFIGLGYLNSKKTVDNKCIDGVDVIINLAGSSVFSLWTKSNKKMILKSRLDSLSIIYKLIKEKKNKVKRIVSASAIGIYPNHKSKVYNYRK